jgi:hypothetical protein
MGDYKIFFQNHLKGLTSRLMTHPRRWYHKKKAKNCKKEKCSIICNNCTGGVILHDLGLRFDTPTINTLFYNADDFLFFVSNIKAFSKSDMYQIPDTNYSYPIGAIKLRERIIKIGLVHYSTFDEGKRKWEERFKRIDYNNLFIIWEGKDITREQLESFKGIQYPKQVYSLDCEDFSKLYPFYVGHIMYRSWFPGKIIEYKHLLSLKRYLDDFNYIKFLNVHSV